MTQPTGVFVRLPLSDKEKLTLWDKVGDDKCDAAVLDIGTPVMGGDIPVVTTLGTLRDPVPCIRQSDHLAAIAVLEAEVGRLRSENEREDKAHTQTITERDEAEDIIAEMYQAVMGDPPEWSGSFGFRDAVDDIVDYVHALRTHPFQKIPETQLNNIVTLTEQARKNISIVHGGRKMARAIAPILDEIDAEIAALKGPEA